MSEAWIVKEKLHKPTVKLSHWELIQDQFMVYEFQNLKTIKDASCRADTSTTLGSEMNTNIVCNISFYKSNFFII